ncbi:class I SAM-dependent methyltransferase [Chlorobium phaeovibrioides]|uniref:Class I SAM-dependent methyltransferase n=2 Tax=Chlorobium phaeovibrioides TaxID=1094 RepID=A0A5M8I9C9_CHLPH|nr:class I SAM-dependent methyltransferase [Chlorobium phaeovibrioides]
MTVVSKMCCRICNAQSSKLFSANLLERQVWYYECPVCGYVQTETPYWLDKAYADAINVSDTGIMSRNLANRNIVLTVLLGLRMREAKVIDFAGGYGFLVRLLRDSGVDAYWMDKYCDNLVARGFEYTDKIRGGVTTAFEVFEHLVHPTEAIEEMFGVAPNLLFSTEIMPDSAPSPDAWWYYGLHHGQHIGFYRQRTLQYLAQKYGKVLLSDGRSYHMLCEPDSVTWFSNIFYWSIKLSRFMPLFSSRIWKSKTWSDHELLARERLSVLPAMNTPE